MHFANNVSTRPRPGRGHRSQPVFRRMADACCDNSCGEFLASLFGYGDNYGRLRESSSHDLVIEKMTMDRDCDLRDHGDDLEMGLLRDPATSIDSVDSGGDARDSPSSSLIRDRPHPPAQQLHSDGSTPFRADGKSPSLFEPSHGNSTPRHFVTHFDVDPSDGLPKALEPEPGIADPSSAPPKIKLPKSVGTSTSAIAVPLQLPLAPTAEPLRQPALQPMAVVPARPTSNGPITPATVTTHTTNTSTTTIAVAARRDAVGELTSLDGPTHSDDGFEFLPQSTPTPPPRVADEHPPPAALAPVTPPVSPAGRPVVSPAPGNAHDKALPASETNAAEPVADPPASHQLAPAPDKTPRSPPSLLPVPMPVPLPPAPPAEATPAHTGPPEAATGEGGAEAWADAPGPVATAADAVAEPTPEQPSQRHEPLMPSDENDEPIEDYREGGYHPVALGDVFNSRFKITAKLGWGMYSTVWMGEDQAGVLPGVSPASSTQRVALKVQKSSEDYYQAAVNEIKLLKAVRAAADDSRQKNYVVRLIDAFDVVGPNGTHPCMVFEPLGESLFAVLQQHNQIPYSAVRRITAQLLRGLQFLHSCNILHTDLKPENVLVVRSPLDAQKDERDIIRLSEDDFIVGVKIVDLGNAFFGHDQDVYDIQTREYRCIESMLGIWPFKPVADVWSLGCLAFELVTGETLFDPQLPPDVDPSALEESDFIKDESHLHQCLELVGPIPLHVIQQGERSPDWFDEDGSMRSMPDPVSSEGIIMEVLVQNFEIDPEPAQVTEAFVKFTLCYDPDDRPSAEECMTHPFVDDR